MTQDDLRPNATPPELALLAEALPPLAPDPEIRAKLVAQLQGSERFSPWARDVAQHFGLHEDAARAALRLVPDASAWQPGPWRGSRLLVTRELLAASTMLACLPPGMRIERHRHHTRELTYVLDGELSSDGVLHGTGSLLVMEPDSEHTVTVSTNADCLVVFSVRFSAP